MAFRLLLFTCLAFISCQKESFNTCTDTRSLHESFTYPLGVAYEPNYANSDSSYQAISKRHFSRWTPENVLKWSSISFQPYQYYWEEADAFVAEGLAAGKLLHGHTLIWYRQEPSWLGTLSLNRQGWEELLRTHIRTVMTRYVGKFSSWDVVNEAFLEDGRLRPCIWLTHLGAEYLFIAYEEASKADPKALLFYNDYGMEDNPAKLNAVLRWIDQMRERGIQLHGIGLQMHVLLHYPNLGRTGNTFFRLAEKGLKLHLSELDVALNDPMKPGEKPSALLLTQQAYRYQEIIRMYHSLPTRAKFGITLWGISDRYSWLRTPEKPFESPLLWDENYQPKPAFCAFAR